jgi:nitroreductase
LARREEANGETGLDESNRRDQISWLIYPLSFDDGIEEFCQNQDINTVNPSDLPSGDQLLAAIAHRRSMGLSRLKSDPVDRSLVEKMVRAADWAPSHGDTEPWRFQVFMDEGRNVLANLFEKSHRDDAGEDAKPEILEALRKRAFSAPVWISISMVPELKEDGSFKMSEEEELMAVACAVQNLHLMANTLGLAGMWHSKGISIHPAVAKGLGLEAPSRLLGFFMCGWPNCEWPEGERRPIEEKVGWA